jgi:hypothetical protein
VTVPHKVKFRPLEEGGSRPRRSGPESAHNGRASGEALADTPGLDTQEFVDRAGRARAGMSTHDHATIKSEPAMQGTKILQMQASDLVGRIVVNPNRVEFLVTDLTFDARTGQVVIEIDEIDETTGMPAGLASGVFRLDGWLIANRLRPSGP